TIVSEAPCEACMRWFFTVPMNMCYFFFFFRPVLHNDLPSFPTRRSSDLQAPQAPQTPVEAPPDSYTPPTRAQAKTRIEPMSTMRSEEHTSELQSRFDLVCRLLLEKKKTTALHRLCSPMLSAS